MLHVAFYFYKGKSWIQKVIPNLISTLNVINNVFQIDLVLRVTDGKCIFWIDKWVIYFEIILMNTYFINQEIEEGVEVSYLCIQNRNGMWLWEGIISIGRYNNGFGFCCMFDAQSDSSTSLNYMLWKGSNNTTNNPRSFFYSVFYRIASRIGCWKFIQVNCLLPKVEVFVWKLLKNRIPTKVELVKCSVIFQELTYCSFCCKEKETNQHIFF